MCAALLKVKKRATTSSTRSKDWTGVSCTHLCMLQYSANMAAFNYYMCLLIYEGRGHVQRCQECKGELQAPNQVKALVPIAHIPDSATHAHGLRNLTDTCNSPVRPYFRSIGACTSVHNWHQSFDLVELVVALFFTFNSAAHIRGLIYFDKLCSGLRRPYLQIIGVCTSVHDQYKPSSLLHTHWR
jgi:hypothetical protein